MGEPNAVSSGVQELIARIRDDGVQAGQDEADHLVQQAQQRAAEIVQQAQSEAERLLSQARADIDREAKAARDALQLAVRNTVLEFRTVAAQRFSDAVKGLVTKELQDADFIRQIILAIAARAAPDEADGRTLDLLLSDAFFPGESDEQQAIHDFVTDLASEVVRAGIELKPSGRDQTGIRLRLVGEELEIDMTDEALSSMLLSHLLPRFRAYVTDDR